MDRYIYVCIHSKDLSKGIGVLDSPALVSHSSTGTIDMESKTPQNRCEERIHFHAVPAPTADDDLLKQVFPVEREETMRGVVQCNTVERHTRDMVPLKACQEKKGIFWVLCAGEVDMAQVLFDLITGVYRHAWCCQARRTSSSGEDSGFARLRNQRAQVAELQF